MPLTNLNRKLERIDRPAPAIPTAANRGLRPASFGSAGPASIGPKRSKKKLFLKIFIVLVIIGLAIYIPARNIYAQAKVLKSSAKVIADGAKNENLDQIQQGLTSTRLAVESMNGSLNWLFYLRVIPFVGGYYSDAKHFMVAADYELKASDTVVQSLDPYKQELGFTGQPITGPDRISQAVKVLDKVLPHVDTIEPNLKAAQDEVEGIDTSKYPEKLGNTQVRSRVEEAKNFIIGAHYAVTQAKPALQVAPSALGHNGAKTYLILFQNDKELRATGGFLTAYAFMKLDEGHLSTTKSDDIYRLDEQLLNVCKTRICPLTPPAPIAKYLPEADGKPRTAWSLRDSNLSPDVPTFAKTFENMYSYLGNDKFDGIILIDTQVVEQLIAITGPVDVFGTTFSADMDKRCNCPNVIYELENYAEIAAKGQTDRKAVLGTLMQQVLGRVLASGTDKLPDFINTAVQLAQGKHMMLYMHDQQTESALADLNWTGQIKDTQGDYLHVNDSNFAGGKSNLYVDETVTYEVTTGSPTHAKLTIEYKNPQPFNIWLNGINRDYVRIYVPEGSKLTSSKGSDDPVQTQQDDALHKTYFEAFVQVRPQNSRILSFEYDLPVQPNGKTYSILIQKQPGAKDHHYTVKVNGKKIDEFNLTGDTQLSASL